MALISDPYGRSSLNGSPPQRVVSLCPPITELLFDLGIGKRVVGVSKQCRFPEVRVKEAALVGSNKRPDIKRIQELKPDFIVLDSRETDRAVVELLKEECPVWDSSTSAVIDAIEEIRLLGRIMDKSDNAEWLAGKIETRFAEFLAGFEKNDEVIRVSFLASYKPWAVYGAETLANELLTYIGIGNSWDFEKGICQVDIRKIAGRPSVILLSEGPYSFHKRHVPVVSRKLPEARVYLVREDQLTWHGSRLLRAPAYLAELHKMLISS